MTRSATVSQMAAVAEVRRGSRKLYAAIRFTAGFVLVLAALLKILLPSRAPWLIALHLESNRWVMPVVVAVEIWLGGALLFNAAPRITLRLALLCFAAFGGVSIYLWARSSPSCGCFGALPIPPWATASLDGVMAASLLYAVAIGQNIAARRRHTYARVGAALILGLISGAFLFRSAAIARATAAGDLAVDQEIFDIGKLHEDQARSISHRFLLTNNTDHTIHIGSVDHTCTCTDAKAETDIIAPHQTIGLVANVKWQGRRGSQRADVIVNTVNPSGMLLLTVTGVIDVGIAISPSVMNLGTIPPGTVAERLVFVSRTDGAEATTLRLRDVKSSTEAIVAEPINIPGRNGIGSWFRVRADGGRLPIGSDSAEITFLPEDQRLKPVVLRIRYRQINPIVALTPSLRFPPTGAAVQTARFQLFSPLHPRLEIRADDSSANPSQFSIAVVRHVQNQKGEVVEVDVRSAGDESFAGSARLIATIRGTEIASVSLSKF